MKAAVWSPSPVPGSPSNLKRPQVEAKGDPVLRRTVYGIGLEPARAGERAEVHFRTPGRCRPARRHDPARPAGARPVSPSSREGAGASALCSSHRRLMARLATYVLNPRRWRCPRSLPWNDVKSQDASRCASLRPARQALSRSSMFRTASSAMSLATPLAASSRRIEAALLGLREERLSRQSEANSASFTSPRSLRSPRTRSTIGGGKRRPRRVLTSASLRGRCERKRRAALEACWKGSLSFMAASSGPFRLPWSRG